VEVDLVQLLLVLVDQGVVAKVREQGHLLMQKNQEVQTLVVVVVVEI
tara:strand:+ start:386 stop:526 length:141 start_codon:yes stop_codon:yes gene_type:complete